MAHCSKVFVCNNPEKSDSKCSTEKALPSVLAQTCMQSCFRYHWVKQDEHVREYNWNQIVFDVEDYNELHGFND